MFIDSHIHLTHPLFAGKFPCIVDSKETERIKYMDRPQLIKVFKDNDILFCIEPGIDLESNYKILELVDKYPDFLFSAIGVHPTRAPQTKWGKRKELINLADNLSVIAIGELGLDYHYERFKQHRIRQKMWFAWQLKLAYKNRLPLILHIRLADADAIKMLRQYKNKLNGGVCHCFNQSPNIARIYTEEFGFMLGIGGSLLQEGCEELEQTVRQTPLEYLILETDGPYVRPARPENVTGKKWKKSRNNSLIIPDIAQRVAELKNIDIAEVERITTENVIRVFKLDVKISKSPQQATL